MVYRKMFYINEKQSKLLNKVECVFFDNIVINDDVLQQSLLRNLNDVILSWAFSLILRLQRFL